MPQTPKGYVLLFCSVESTLLTELKRGRTCTPRRGGERSHTMPPYFLVNCKKCHAAKCFRHILDMNVHSSEAILAVAADPSGIVWHQLHQNARQRDLPSHWIQRQPVGLAERLVFFASNFSSTSPVNGETSIGFYDGQDLRVWRVFSGVCGLLLTSDSDSRRIGIHP
jgi:hypothetical protein